MTNSQLNAYLDKTCFNSVKMCNDGELCVEQDPEGDCRVIADGGTWAACSEHIPHTPPDYCSDWAAFGRLWEWVKANCLGIEVADYDRCIITLALGNDGTSGGDSQTLPLALARAVYEATKGK